MEYRLLTLLLMRVKNTDEWEEALPPGSLEDRLGKVQDRFRHDVEGREGQVWPDPMGRHYDSFLASFSAPSSALEAAHALIAYFVEGGEGLPAGAVQVGCAVNTGEVLVRGDQVIGGPLDVVSRLEHRAEAGQILFTEASLLSIGRTEGIGYRVMLERISGSGGPEMRAFILEEPGGGDGES